MDLVRLLPTISPIGVMERSTPRVKNTIPIVNRTAPIRNASKMLGEIGAIVKHNSKTMPTTGSTAFKVSFSFSRNFD